MLDPNLLKNNLENLKEVLQVRRNYTLDTDLITELDNKRKTFQVELESILAERNAFAKEIGMKKSRGEDVTKLLEEVSNDNSRQESVKKELDFVQAELDKIYSSIPNIPADEVPVGSDENDNLEVYRFGTPRTFDFAVRDHVTLGEMRKEFNFEKAAELSKSRFIIMQGQLARMHRALIHFMLDLHTTQHNYTECYVPYMVNQNTLFGTGQLPKFSEDLFKIQPLDKDDEREFYLIPTAEVPLTNTVANTILQENELPIKLTAHTPCFRSEAGSYGRDTRGLIRMHQFEKVELVRIVEPSTSMQALEELTSEAEQVLKLLELPYRKVLLCTGDLGFSSCKTYDLEVWLPGQNTYREISSCSNMRDFQARRMKARFKSKDAKKPQLVHTLNGSGLAVGRTLVAIMENYQQADGSIAIPKVLQPYMGNLTSI